MAILKAGKGKANSGVAQEILEAIIGGNEDNASLLSDDGGDFISNLEASEKKVASIGITSKTFEVGGTSKDGEHPAPRTWKVSHADVVRGNRKLGGGMDLVVKDKSQKVMFRKEH